MKAAALLAFALASLPAPAAATEVSTGLQLGYGRRLGDAPEGLSILGLRTDVLFGRDSKDDLAVGLHAGFSAPDPFHEAQGDLGLSLLLPVTDAWPIVISGGGWLGSGAPAGGVLGRLFWGVRPHNVFSPYVTTLGLFVETRASLWGAKSIDVSGGLHVDGFVFLYPFLILWESIWHGWPW